MSLNVKQNLIITVYITGVKILPSSDLFFLLPPDVVLLPLCRGVVMYFHSVLVSFRRISKSFATFLTWERFDAVAVER